MIVEIDNITARIRKINEAEEKWLFAYLSFNDKKGYYKKGRFNQKIQKIHLYNRLSQEFPAGLVSVVKKAAAKKDFKLVVYDKRPTVEEVDHDADIDWLRWYQKDAVTTCQDCERGIVQAPTGSGKTEIFCALVKSTPVQWLFLVHRKDLVTNAAERYTLRTGEQPFIYKKGKKPGNERVILASFQAMAAAIRRKDPTAIKILEQCEGLVVDECHVLPANSFYNVVKYTKNAYYRIGLSGTPLARGDQKSLMAIAALGPVIYRIKSQMLINEGVLAKPKIRLLRVEQVSTRPTYQGVYGECIIRSKKRNEAVVHAVKNAAKPCLVFVSQVKHGKILKKMLEREEIVSDFVYGQTGETAREWAKSNVIHGAADVMIASVVWQEGIDMPNLRSVVMAAGGKSIIATLQKIGRGMRTDQGKKMEFEVWDVMDIGQKWLQKHARARMKTYTREGYDTTIVPWDSPQAELPLEG